MLHRLSPALPQVTTATPAPEPVLRPSRPAGSSCDGRRDGTPARGALHGRAPIGGSPRPSSRRTVAGRLDSRGTEPASDWPTEGFRIGRRGLGPRCHRHGRAIPPGTLALASPPPLGPADRARTAGRCPGASPDEPGDGPSAADRGLAASGRSRRDRRDPASRGLAGAARRESRHRPRSATSWSTNAPMSAAATTWSGCSSAWGR